MAYNFEKALQSGLKPEKILEYLSSQGRQKEGLDYFQKMGLPIKPKLNQGFDTAGAIREIPPLAGFLGGEFLGGPVGAGVGTALGETISQSTEKFLGKRKEINRAEIAKKGVEATGIAFGVPLAFKGAGKVLQFGGKTLEPLTNIAKSGLAGIKKVLPGISDESSLAIKNYTLEVESLAKQKNLPINYLIDKNQKAVNAFEKSIGDTYQAKWQKLLKEGEKYSFDNQKTIETINNFLEKEAKQGTLYFKRLPNGNLDFTNSPFTEKQANDVIQKIIDRVENTHPENIAEIRALKQGINNIYQEHITQLGKSPQLDRFVNNMIDAVDQGLPPKLRDISKEYSNGLKFLQKVNELLLPETPSGLLRPSSISKTKSLGKEEIQQLYPDFLKEFKAKTGIDLKKELDIFNAAREINPNLIPQDTGGITRGIQRAANPLIGTAKIETAKAQQGLLNPAAQGIYDFLAGAGEQGARVANLFKQGAMPAAKSALLELLSNPKFQPRK